MATFLCFWKMCKGNGRGWKSRVAISCLFPGGFSRLQQQHRSIGQNRWVVNVKYFQLSFILMAGQRHQTWNIPCRLEPFRAALLFVLVDIVTWWLSLELLQDGVESLRPSPSSHAACCVKSRALPLSASASSTTFASLTRWANRLFPNSHRLSSMAYESNFSTRSRNERKSCEFARLQPPWQRFKNK